MKWRIVFDKDVLDADVDRLRGLGYPDDLIELFIEDGQARARPLGPKLSLVDHLRMMLWRKQ